MRFARIIFWLAAIEGVLILTPVYFLYDTVGRQYPPPLTHPENYFGFLAVAMAWQAAFFVIGSDPIRFRPLMVPAMLEKFGYVGTLAVLYALGRLPFGQFIVVVPDGLLGVLFVVAYAKTASAEEAKQATTRLQRA